MDEIEKRLPCISGYIHNDSVIVLNFLDEKLNLEQESFPLQCELFVAVIEIYEELFFHEIQTRKCHICNNNIKINTIQKDKIKNYIKTNTEDYIIENIKVSCKECFYSITEMVKESKYCRFVVEPFFDSLCEDENLVENYLYFEQIPIFYEFEQLESLVFDIEVTNNRIVFPKCYLNTIILIGIFVIKDSKNNIYEELVLVNQEEIKEELSEKQKNISDTYSIINCQNEKELINEFLKIIKSCEIIVTYNGHVFDIPWIMNKIKIYGIPLEEGQDLEKKIHIDCYKWVDKHSLLSEQNKTLKGIAQEYLKMNNVVEIPYYEINETKEQNPLELCEYVLSDVSITWTLYQKHVNLFSIQMSELLCTHVEFVNQCSNSDLCLLYISHQQFDEKSRELETVLLNQENEFEYFEGAKTESFFTGIYSTNNDIYHFDVSAMYPSIMLQFNIEPWNLDGCNRCPESQCQCVSLKLLNEEELNDVVINQNNLFYSEEIVKNLFNERNNYKKIMEERKLIGAEKDELDELDAKELSLKTLINSLYGLFGYKKQGNLFDYFYNPKAAKTVTTIGRHCLNIALTFFENQNCKNLQCDTDGIWVDCKGEDGKQLLETLNEKIKNEFEKVTIGENYLKFELKGPFKAILIPTKNKKPPKKKEQKKETKKNNLTEFEEVEEFEEIDKLEIAKKRYIVFNEQGKECIIKGFEVLKKNTNLLEKKFFLDVIEILEDNLNDKNELKEKLDNLLESYREEITEPDEPIDMLWKLAEKNKYPEEEINQESKKVKTDIPNFNGNLEQWYVRSEKLNCECTGCKLDKFDGVLIRGIDKEKDKKIGERRLPIELICEYLKYEKIDDEESKTEIDKLFFEIMERELDDEERTWENVIDVDYYIKKLENEIEKLNYKE